MRHGRRESHEKTPNCTFIPHQLFTRYFVPFAIPSYPQPQNYNSSNGAGYNASQYGSSGGGGGGGGGSYGGAGGGSSAVVSSGNAGRTKLTGAPTSTAGFMPVADYARLHDLQTLGENVPQPLQTFESVGFPPDMLEEVRHTPFAGGLEGPHPPLYSSLWAYPSEHIFHGCRAAPQNDAPASYALMKLVQ